MVADLATGTRASTLPTLQGREGAKRSYVQRNQARRGRERAGRAAWLFPCPWSATVCSSPGS